MYHYVFDRIEHGFDNINELVRCELIVTEELKLKYPHSLTDGFLISEVEGFINNYTA